MYDFLDSIQRHVQWKTIDSLRSTFPVAYGPRVGARRLWSNYKHARPKEEPWPAASSHRVDVQLESEDMRLDLIGLSEWC